MNHKFTGVWIPAQVWLSTELTMQEKFFVAEIEALSTTGPCFASNEYLAEFSQLSVPRVKSVLSSLEKKGWLIRNTKHTQAGKRRTMSVNRSKYYPKNESASIGNDTLQGLDSIPCKDRIQSIYNKEDNKELETLGSSDDKPADTPAKPKNEYTPEFEEIWKEKPNRAGSNPKRSAFKAYKARLKDNATPEEILAGLLRYKKHLEEQQKLNTPFVMQMATFLGPDEHFREQWTFNTPKPEQQTRKINDL
ncbi:DNA replication protein [Oceanospirillum phage vB_OliS_GJ44]|nr:DNA replication protein [Oceanospirillum phage vB_OliS_GJ44]